MKISKLRVTGLCEGFPAQRASNAEKVSIWMTSSCSWLHIYSWDHHAHWAQTIRIIELPPRNDLLWLRCRRRVKKNYMSPLTCYIRLTYLSVCGSVMYTSTDCYFRTRMSGQLDGKVWWVHMYLNLTNFVRYWNDIFSHLYEAHRLDNEYISPLCTNFTVSLFVDNSRNSTNVFKPGFWLACSTAASQSKAMLQNLCKLTRIYDGFY